MTVVPCLADHPRHTGQPPAPEAGAVLVLEPRPDPPGPEPAGEGKLARDPGKLARPVGLRGGNTAPAGEAATEASVGNAAAGIASAPSAADEAASTATEASAVEAHSADLGQPGDAAAPDAVKSTAAKASSAEPAQSATDSANPISAASATPQPAEPLRPAPDHPARVRVVVDWDPFSRPPRRVATRDEMLASAHRVLARRQPGRHRKPDNRDPWISRAADFVVAWAATLRLALLLLAGAAFLTGLALMNSPIAGVAVTSVTLAAGVAAWVARPRRSPTHRC